MEEGVQGLPVMRWLGHSDKVLNIHVNITEGCGVGVAQDNSRGMESGMLRVVG